MWVLCDDPDVFEDDWVTVIIGDDRVVSPPSDDDDFDPVFPAYYQKGVGYICDLRLATKYETEEEAEHDARLYADCTNAILSDDERLLKAQRAYEEWLKFQK